MNDTVDRSRIPLVDGSVLAQLRDELEPDTWYCNWFIHNYIALMPTG